MSIVQGTLPVGSLDHAITLNVQSSGGSHFETVTYTTPYLHRASPQDVASSMKLKKVVGGTIAWNQYNKNDRSTSTVAGVTWSSANGIVTVQGKPSARSYAYSEKSSGRMAVTSGHVLLSMVKVISGTVPTGMMIGGSFYLSPDPYTWKGNWNSTKLNTVFKVPSGVDTITRTLYDITADAVTLLDGGSVDMQLQSQLFDLTQMFGSTIADYIYSLEQAHAGDGVAWFKSLFPKAYYPYNAGELMSVKTSARKTYNADNVEIGSYALDSDLELRGIPKLDGNNELYYDGDTYASDGTVTRKYGTVTFNGSETWYWDNNNVLAWTIVTGGVITNGVSQYETWLVDDNAELISTSWAERTVNDGSMGMYYGQSRIYVKKSTITSANDAKTYFTNNPTNVIYALETPTTESADAYTQSQRVGATEEFVDGRTVEIPVGNESEYKRLIQED